MISGTQFKYLSHGGRVTPPPRKITRRPWCVRKYWSEVDERRKVPSEGSRKPNRRPHRMSQAFLAGAGDVPLEGKAGRGIQRFGKGILKLLDGTQALAMTVSKVHYL